MEITVRQIQLGAENFLGVIDENEVPAFYHGEQRYADLPALLAAFPALLEETSLAAYCQAALLFAGGSGYRYSADPAATGAGYLRRADSEFLRSLEEADWGNHRADYDFDVIREPQVAGDTVTFFAEEQHFGTPYAVTVPYPWDDVAKPATFRLLPATTAAAFA